MSMHKVKIQPMRAAVWNAHERIVAVKKGALAASFRKTLQQGRRYRTCDSPPRVAASQSLGGVDYEAVGLRLLLGRIGSSGFHLRAFSRGFSRCRTEPAQHVALLTPRAFFIAATNTISPSLSYPDQKIYYFDASGVAP